MSELQFREATLDDATLEAIINQDGAAVDTSSRWMRSVGRMYEQKGSPAASSSSNVTETLAIEEHPDDGAARRPQGPPCATSSLVGALRYRAASPIRGVFGVRVRAM